MSIYYAIRSFIYSSNNQLLYTHIHMDPSMEQKKVWTKAEMASDVWTWIAYISRDLFSFQDNDVDDERRQRKIEK